MSRIKKTFLVIGVCFLTLLVLSNSFCIFLLIKSNQAEKSAPDPYYEMTQRKQVLLRYTPDSPVDREQSRQLIRQTLKNSPSILYDEPIIFIANPDLMPLVAEILEEDPSILYAAPLTLYYYPELMEMNTVLKTVLEDIIANTDNPNIKTLLESVQ